MKPNFFKIERGCYKIGTNPFVGGLDNKPVKLCFIYGVICWAFFRDSLTTKQGNFIIF